MQIVVSMDEFRKNLADFVARAMYGDQIVRVRKHSKNGVVVVSEREYENLKDPRKRFATRAGWDKFFVFTDKVRDRMSENDRTELERITDEEVKAVRA